MAFRKSIGNILIPFILLTGSVGAWAQTSFAKEVNEVYNFTPHKMKRADQEKIFPELDKFFAKVMGDTTKYLPLLRQELEATGHFPYFYYDAAHLLMIASKHRSDKVLSAKSFTKSEVKDLDPKIYTYLISQLAREQIDVTDAALKVLQDSTFNFFVPEHAMDFSQEYCLTYMLLPLDPEIYVDKLIAYFQTTKSLKAKQSIITVLWFARSCKGDSLLNGLSDARDQPRSLVKYVRNLPDKITTDEKEYLSGFTRGEVEELIPSALSRFSDEAIAELVLATKQLRKGQHCR
jgi:hypothetical protein